MIRGLILPAAAFVLIAATISGAVLSATVSFTESGGSTQTNAVAPFSMSTAGQVDSEVLSSSTLNVQLCENGSTCPAANEIPFGPSPSRTRMLSTQHFATTTSSYTDETADANDAGANDVALVSTTPTVDDAFYFLSDHPYRILWLDIGTAGDRATTDWTLTWEYYNGSIYTALSNVTDNSDAFTVSGTSTVSWDIPSDMATDTVATTTGYSVRARITAAGAGTVTQPLATQIWYETGLWWVFHDSAAGQSVESYTMWLGGPEIRTYHHVFPGSSGLTTADHADLELGSNFDISLEAFIDTDTGSGKHLARKIGAFELSVSATTSGSILARVWSRETATIRPDGAGDYTNIDTQIPSSGAHWDKVDEAVEDEATTEIRSFNVAEQRDVFTADDVSIPAGANIVQVEVFFRVLLVDAAHARPLLRLSGAETLGTIVTCGCGWTTFSEVLDRPGGGPWSASDINSLQLGIGLASNTSSVPARATQVYAVVTWDVAYDATVTNIATGEHAVSASATGTLVTLDVDGSIATSSVTSLSVPDNSNAWTFVSGGSVQYMASTSIDVSGSQVLLWQVNQAEDALTITDQSGTEQNATSSFPTVSSTLIGSIGTFATTNAPPALSSQQPGGVAVSIASTTIFAATTTIGAGLPGGAFLASVASDANVPVAFLWIMVGVGMVVLSIVLVQGAIKNILYAVVAGGVVVTAFATPAVGVFPVWGIMFYAILGGVAVIIGRRLGVSV